MGIENKDLDPYFGKLNQDQKGFDLASGASSKDVLKFDFHPVSGGDPVGKKKPKYADAKDKNITRKNGDGQEVLKTLKEKFVPNADLPTTASAPPGLDLAKIIAQVDPTGKAQVFPNMVKQFAMIKSIMNIAAGGGGASAAPSLSQQNTLTDAFSEALCILCKKASYVKVMASLEFMLLNNGITRIDPGYQDIVRNGITNLVQKALIFGENNIPIKPVPKVTYGQTLPPAKLIITDYYYVPDLSIKQYYSEETDPFLGYIQYLNNDQTYCYVKRTKIDYPYQTVDDECLAIAEKGIADDMYPYIILMKDPRTKIPMVLTTDILNSIFIKHKVNHENNAMDRAIGKNSSIKLMANLTAILGLTGTLVNLTQVNFLSKSGLNTGAVADALGSFSKGLAMAKTMSRMAQTALKPPTPLGNLAALSSMAGALGGIGIPIPNIAAAVGGISVLSNLTSNLGPVAGIASAIASVPELALAVQTAGLSISGLAANSLGQTVPGVNNITRAMGIAGASAIAVVSTTNVLKNLGL